MADRARGNLDKAIDSLSDIIKKNPDDFAALSTRGLGWHLKGEEDKAIADLNNAIRLEPKYELVYYFRAHALYSKGEMEKSLDDLNRCLKINPKLARACNWRGAIWQSKSEWGKAMEDYSRCLELDPRFTPAIWSRALLYAGCPEDKFRDGKKAVAEANRLCELSGWMNPDHWEVLAAAYSSVGDYDSAIKWQTKADQFNVPRPHAKLTNK